MGDQVLGRSDSRRMASPLVSPAFVVPAIVVSAVIFAACIAIVLLCLQKKKKEQSEDQEKRPKEDGSVHEDLIEANNNSTQVFASPDQASGLKQGVRTQPTRNPEHKKWYESKAIPFMDASVGSIPDAVEAANV